MQEVGRINMNAQGDDHVSFSAAHLALKGKYLLVSTDGPRIIMYDTEGELNIWAYCSYETLWCSCCELVHEIRGHFPKYHPSGVAHCTQATPDYAPIALSTLKAEFDTDWQQKRNFFGLPVEKFHQPVALWHPTGHYIIAAAAHGHIYVFHVGTAKVTVFSPYAFSQVCSLLPCMQACYVVLIIAADGMQLVQQGSSFGTVISM